MSRYLSRRSVDRRILEVFLPYRLQVTAAAVLLFGTGALTTQTPLIGAWMLNFGLFGKSGADTGILLTGLLLTIGLFATSAALDVGRTRLTTVVGNRVTSDLRIHAHKTLTDSELAFFYKKRAGQLISGIQNDVAATAGIATSVLNSVLGNVVSAASMIIAMILLSPPLTLVVLALASPVLFALRGVGRRVERLTNEHQDSLESLLIVLQESLSAPGIILARIYGRERFEALKFRAASTTEAERQSARALVGQWPFAAVNTFFLCGPAVLYGLVGVGTSWIASVEVGTLVAFTAIQIRLPYALIGILNTGIQLRAYRAVYRRVFEQIDEAETAQRRNTNEAPPAALVGDVALQLRDVWFQYSPGTDLDAAVSSVDMEFSKSDVAAIVGPTGSGKSTVLRMLCRLENPTHGSLHLFGTDIDAFPPRQLVQIIELVTQDVYFFHGSIRENLNYARTDLDEDSLSKALEMAAVHEVVNALPAGLETLIGEGGVQLSGGEKQRIAIARAILKDPDVLLLDEATSALDAVTERKVLGNVQAHFKGSLIIMVTHRLSHVTNADKIYVMNRGRVVERGNHIELCAEGGLYSGLWAAQNTVGD